MTLVINAYSVPFPTITNRIRSYVATQLSPAAIIASKIENAPHPSRVWSFPGLIRTNYVFVMEEIDGTGSFVRQLAYFDVVPGDLTTGLFRGEEQIKVGTTSGLVSGSASFTFDGSGGKLDYRGWDISIEEYAGVGTMIRGIDYSWDKATGIFSYLNGLKFQPNQWYTVEFAPQTGGALSVPTVFDFSMRLITSNTTVDIEDFGNKVLVEPSGNYLELGLPPLDTVPSGRPLMIETLSSQAFKCVKVLSNGTDVINFLNGSIYLMMNEKMFIYKFIVGGRKEWRVYNEIGNFINCGQLVSYDLSNVFNKMLMNGAILDKFQYARLYNEVVLRLPVNQRVNYDGWSSTQTFYSLANSTDPSFTNKFRIPNRLGLTEKINSSGRIVGSYEPDAVGVHEHIKTLYRKGVLTFGGDELSVTPNAVSAPGDVVPPYQFGSGTTGTGMSDETKVRNYSTNKYILV